MQRQDEERERETRSLMLSLLSSNPTMMQRPRGNSFGLGPTATMLDGYPSIASLSARNSLQGMHFAAGNSVRNQFPIHRLPASFTTTASTGAIPQSPQITASSISGMTGGAGVKRLGELEDSISKRRKVTSIQDNPLLLERLSSMSGFRMPKWNGGKQPVHSGDGDVTKILLPKHGAFPMPAIVERSTEPRCRYSFDKFSKLWKETDEDIRAEVLARRLEQTKVPIPPRNYKGRIVSI